MSRRDIFSTLFMSPEASKAKIYMAPTDGGDGTGGGGGGSGPGGSTVAPPVVSSFISTLNTITEGGFIKFTVSVIGVTTSIVITGNGIPSPGLTVQNGVQSSAVVPTSVGDNTYTVTATNSALSTANSSTLTKVIKVLPQPTIISFTSTVSGNNVLLVGTWTPTIDTEARIQYGTNIILNVVSGTTYTVPKPSSDTNYVLQVYNTGGQYFDQRAEKVSALGVSPAITSFSSSNNTVDANTNFTLTPIFNNGTGVISRNKGTFSNNSSSISCLSGVAITTTISETTTFTLKVTATQ